MSALKAPAPARDVDLRCPSHLHGVVLDRADGRVLSIKCHQCSKRAGEPVFHKWCTRTWTMIDPKDERSGDRG